MQMVELLFWYVFGKAVITDVLMGLGIWIPYSVFSNAKFWFSKSVK